MKHNTRWLVAIALLIVVALSSRGGAQQSESDGEMMTDDMSMPQLPPDLDLRNRTNITCAPCLAGSYTNATTNCSGNIEASEHCPEGWCASQSECTRCSPGTFQSSGSSTSCQPCDDGYIAPHEGARTCVPCSAGQQSNINSTACISCGPGTFNKVIGGSCLPCGAGYYNPDYNSSACYLCPTGTYGDGSTMAHCTDCGVGFYNALLGTSSKSGCNQCPAGSYCPYPATETPLQCPAEFYCAAGTSSPVACNWLQTSDAGASQCERARLFWIVTVVIGLGGLVILALLISGVVVMAKRKSADIEKPPVKKERLIPEPLGGPVYGGY